MENVCVLGLGYIGLPTSVLLAENGFKVRGVDINRNIVTGLNNGICHINEPELETRFDSAVKSGNFFASLEPEKADVFIVAVPTPVENSHVPGMSFIKDAIWSIMPYLVPGNLVILESTSPVGTLENIAGWICRGGGIDRGEEILLAYCPERVLPGNIFQELIYNDRIIGGINEESALKARDFYRKFVRGELLVTGARTAELAKLVENSYRDVNIAFANEISLICDKLNINTRHLIKLANRHPRVNILQPGPGVGGHCIAVDPWFIIHSAPRETKLIRTAREVNDSMPSYVVQKIKKVVYGLNSPVITCLGLAYKANTGDLRESPAIQVVTQLVEEKTGKILAVEPNIKALPSSLSSGRIELVGLEEGLEKSEVVVLLVDHSEFLTVDRDLLNEKIVIDTRGVWFN